MPLAPAVADALTALGLPFESDVPLAKRTWWRVGGPADAVVTVTDPWALAALLKLGADTGTPVVPLGNASNLLVSDKGIRGIVVVLAGGLADVTVDGDVLSCGGGLKLTVLLARAGKFKWPGLDPLAGIPGTVGGAVRTNAGTSLGELSDLLVDVEVALPDGTLRTLPKAELDMGYRRCTLPPGAVVTRTRLKLSGDWETSERRMREHLDRRKATQPLDQPSCGSTFRNPPGDTAGRLIEAAGLKGHTIGGAQVSEKHANFLVNLGTATAADLDALIRHVQATVHHKFGVMLEPEVFRVGDP